MRQDLKIWLDRALYFKVDSVCGQSAGPHPSSASAAELSTRRFIFHRISRLCLAQGFGCYVWLQIMISNYNLVLDSGEALDLAKSCACLHILLL